MSLRLKNTILIKNILTWFSFWKFDLHVLLFQCMMFVLISFSNSLSSIFTTSYFLQIHKISCGSCYFTKIPVKILLYRFTIIRLHGFSPWFLQRYVSNLFFETHTLPSLIVGCQLQNFRFFPPTSIYWHPSNLLKFRIFIAPLLLPAFQTLTQSWLKEKPHCAIRRFWTFFPKGF